MKAQTRILEFVKRQPRWRLIVAAGVIVLGGFWLTRGGRAGADSPTFAARRGPLEIKVLEGGSLQALESQELKCEVRVGYQGTKILKIVEEGYLVTEEDVKNEKVLCELDSSELQNKLVQQEIQYQTAAANLTDAQQNYEIQLGQNMTDIKAAEQKARFARMDFDKFIGDTITSKIIEQVGLDDLMAEATNHEGEMERLTSALELPTETPPPPAKPDGQRIVEAMTDVKPVDIKAMKINGAAPVGSESQPGQPAVAAATSPEPAGIAKPLNLQIDFSEYANLDVLGDGEAKQKLRKFDDDLQVAQKELGQALTTLEGTRRLFDKGFVPKNEITRDEIAHESSRLKVQTAETARALFLRYEFPRTAEETLSKYADAVREFDKARRVAISKLAQARARLNSAKGQFEVQRRQRDDLKEQIEKCILRAVKPGLVVYGSGNEDMIYYGGQEPIREGATVRERQAIITIPDLTKMCVKVRIHESYIKKVKKGQQARITVDAFPDEQLTGEVTKVAVLPDSQNRWMSPDLKVYLTTITVDGIHAWVKPGMSAKVEVLVNRLEDVVYVPVQAIAPENGKQFCYVVHGGSSSPREVEIGEFNDEFIQIKSGIEPGELVMLNPPSASPPAGEPKPVREEAEPEETSTAADQPGKAGRT